MTEPVRDRTGCDVLRFALRDEVGEESCPPRMVSLEPMSSLHDHALERLSVLLQRPLQVLLPEKGGIAEAGPDHPLVAVADLRLVFAGDPDEFYEGLETSQAAINQARLAKHVTGPERRLRTGDVFAVRGLPARPDGIGAAAEIWDVSLAARKAAKAALYGAAASTVEEEYAREMVISAEYEEIQPTMEPGQFDVRQMIGKYDLPSFEGGEER